MGKLFGFVLLVINYTEESSHAPPLGHRAQHTGAVTVVGEEECLGIRVTLLAECLFCTRPLGTLSLTMGHILHLHHIWNSIFSHSEYTRLACLCISMTFCFDILGDMST